MQLLEKKISSYDAVVGVIGLGYVGLPLAVACANAGFSAKGFDVDDDKVAAVNSNKSYIEAVSSDNLARLVGGSLLEATSDFSRLAECDIIVICVPTPLNKYREPDLSYVQNSAKAIQFSLRQNQLVVLESTTYPGTTVEVVKPILESGGLKSGSNFFLGFSPEREDPGNTTFSTVKIPKVVSGDGELAGRLVSLFYSLVVDEVVTVSNTTVAEAVKITENVFRSVNIALVNELKVIYDAMGVDVWEVIEAASTKPFGFMPFYPGPGLGGHCIPIDPFYLTWKSREYGLPTRFIELSGEINASMPKYVVARLTEELDAQLAKSLGTSKVLIVGLAYKKNVSDIRESPSFMLMDILKSRNTEFSYHDPYVSEIPETREHSEFAGLKSVNISLDNLKAFDAVLICTDHDSVDYDLIAKNAGLVIDTRNAFGKRGISAPNIRKA